MHQFVSYLNGFLENNPGIPHHSRAREILFVFVTKTLQSKATAYPAIGQKKLNWAASRMMLGFAVVLSKKVVRERGLDVDRLGIMSTLFRNRVVEPLPKIIIGNQWLPPAGGSPMFSRPFIKFHWFVQLMGRGLSNPWSMFFGDICLICNPPRFCILSFYPWFLRPGPIKKNGDNDPVKSIEGFYMEYRENYNRILVLLFWKKLG